MENKYAKLKDIDQFTIKSIASPHFQKWDKENKQMLKDPGYVEGYKKVWEATTDKGILTLSRDQMGQMLIAFLDNGKCDVVGKTFKVKTNGKEGMEIRYFINGVYDAPSKSEEEPKEDGSELPF